MHAQQGRRASKHTESAPSKDAPQDAPDRARKAPYNNCFTALCTCACSIRRCAESLVGQLRRAERHGQAAHRNLTHPHLAAAKQMSHPHAQPVPAATILALAAPAVCLPQTAEYH